ncbi:hypothetical protein [Streptomyces sp. NPDC002644]
MESVGERIERSKIVASENWAADEAVLITKNVTSWGHYWNVVLADTAGEVEEELLSLLSEELRKPWRECVVTEEVHEMAHPAMPGSSRLEFYHLFAN